ncbi:MAG: menaquinone-specific isochorismate synthase [Acidimicrobiaceae bacterium]|nr:menaquinone-specific isochorismate synthase [Acidimicrobiaceae bacterium]
MTAIAPIPSPRPADQAAARSLVARTVPLDLPQRPDLVSLAGDDGLLFAGPDGGLAGRGAALVIDLPGGLGDLGAADTVADALAAIATDDELRLPGCGPVAIGALPFERDRPSRLVVPRVLVGVDATGQAWLTTVGEGEAPRLGLDALSPPAPRPSPDSFTLRSGQSHAEWCEMVAAAVDAVQGGPASGMDKVVLAREVVVEANRPIHPSTVLARLRSLYPSCMLFCVDGYLGASPELLVSRMGHAVRSHPLAGTIAHSGDPAVDQAMAAGLLASAKERHEHRVVVEAVAAALAPLCEDLAVPDSPTIVTLRNVSHLGTLVTGTLHGEPPPDALSLLARLHPTPAVGGVPSADALAYIRAVEPFDRGPYAGPVGWMDARGDGVWAVGIRSASVSGSTARLVAGVGIVADSVPEAELAETQLKLQALLAAVVRP